MQYPFLLLKPNSTFCNKFIHGSETLQHMGVVPIEPQSGEMQRCVVDRRHDCGHPQVSHRLFLIFDDVNCIKQQMLAS